MQTFEDQLDGLREAKYGLYLEVGNLRDINRMSMKDFNNLMRYLKIRNAKKDNEPVPLKKSQQSMIDKFKEKNKKNKEKKE